MKARRIVLCVGLFATAFVAVAKAQGPNLVTDGTFSSGLAGTFTTNYGYFGGSNSTSATGWTGGTGVAGTSYPVNQAFAPTNNVPSFMFIQGAGVTATQAISTTVGHIYGFLYSAAERSGNVGGLSVYASNTQAASMTITCGSTSFQNYGFAFTGSGSQTIQFTNSSGTADHTADVTNVSVADISGVWSGGVSNILGNSDLNFGAGNLNFSTASSYSNNVLYFDDTNGAGGTVPNTTLTTVAGGVSAGTLQFNNSAVNYTVNSSDAIGITGATAVVKSGTGTLTLAGANSYTGNTTISAGTLTIGSAGQLGGGNYAGNVSIASGALFNYNSSATQSLSGIISGAGGLTQQGPGTVTLNGAAVNTYTGATTVNGGTLLLDFSNLSTPTNLITSASGLTMGGGTLAINGNSANNTAQTVASLTVNPGASTISLTPNNGKANNLAIASATVTKANGGLLNFQLPANTSVSWSAGLSNGIIGPGFTIGSGTNTRYATVTSGSIASYNSATPLVPSSASSTTNYVATASVTLTGATAYLNTILYTGTSSGTISYSPYNLGFNGLIADGPAGTTLTLGTGSNYICNDGDVASGDMIITGPQNVTIAGYLNVNNGSSTHLGSFTYAGGGTLTLAGGSSTYDTTGPIYLASGVISLGNANCVPNVSSYTFNGGTLQFTLANTGDISSKITNSTAPISIDTNNQNVTFASVIGASNTGGLSKINGGTLILNATEAYTGPTTIGGGTLQIGSGGTAGSINSTSSVLDNGTLAFSRSDSYGGPLAVPIGGTGTLALSGGTLVLAGNNSYSGSTAINGGALYLNGSNATTAISLAGSTTLGGSGSATSAAVTVANGGSIQAGYNGTGSLALGGLSFSNSGTINISGVANYAGNAAINVSGALNASGGSSVVLALAGAAPVSGSGTDQLIQYGSLTGSGSAAFTLNTSALTGSSPRATYTLSNPAGYIDLNWLIDFAVWSGAGNGTWDTVTQSPKNWVLNSNSSATDFLAGDTPLFNDSATNTTVNINGTGNVSPGLVTFANLNKSYTLQGNYGIAGGASLLINGGGAVTISNTNGYTGGTTVTNGSTLTLNAAQAIGTGPLVLAVSGGTISANAAQSPSAVMVNAGLLNIGAGGALGSGTLTVSGGSLDNTSGGSMTLSGNNPENWDNSFAFGGSSPLNTGTGAVTLNASPTVTVAGSGALTVGGAIGGSGSITKAGPGTLVLAGGDTYTGVTLVSGGSLVLANAAALGMSTFDASGQGSLSFGTLTSATFGGLQGSSGTLALSNASAAALALTVGNNGGTTTFGGILTGIGSLTKAGGGVLALAGSNSYTGQTTISGGTLQLNSGGALSSTPLLNNGALVVNGTGNFTQGINFPANISGTGALVNAGTGTLVLNGANTFSGVTTASAGTIALGNNLALQNSPLGTSGTGVFTLSVTAPTFGGLSGSGNLSTAIASGYGNVTALTLNPATSVTYSGVVSDGTLGMAVVMAGAGTQVFTGANTYTGATILNAGTLQIGAGGASGSLTSGTLAMGGGALVLNNTSTGFTQNFTATTLNPGASSVTATAGTLNLGTITRSVGSTVNFAATGAVITSTAGSNGILGGYATFGTSGGTTWAVANGASAINGLSSYTASVAGTTAPGATANVDFQVSNGTASAWGTQSINSLRFNSAASTLTLASTGALTDTSGGILMTSAAGATTITGGTLQGAAGQDLVVIQNNASNGLTIASAIADNGPATALTKSGPGTLTLSGANTYTGGTVINGGTVSYTADSNLGGSGKNVTFNGTGTLNFNFYGATTTLGSLAINNGATATLNGQSSNETFAFAGAATGNGTLTILSPGGGGATTVSLNSTANTFTGPIVMGNAAGATLNFDSLPDSASPTPIYMQASSSYSCYFAMGASAVANVALTNRYLQLGTNLGAVIENNNTTHTLAFYSNLQVTGTGTENLDFNGNLGGTNVFGGVLSNGSASVVNINIDPYLGSGGPGTSAAWYLSNANNTYTGTTALGYGSPSLIVNNIANIGAPSSLGESGAIFVGNNQGNGTATLTFAGAGSTSNRTIQFPGNNYGSALLNNGTGPLIFTGTYFNDQGAAGGVRTLTLGGTYTTSANQIQGIIRDNTGYALAITESGSGSWIFSGSNTYSGATSVSAGTLIVGNGTTGSLGNTAVGVSGGMLQLSASGAVSQNTVTVTSPGSLTETVASALSGSAALTITSGIATLSQSNNYSGVTTLNGGILAVGNDNAIGGPLTLGAGTIQSFDANPHTLSNTLNALGASVAVGGSGNLTFSNTAPVSLGANCTFTISNPQTTFAQAFSGTGFGITKAGSGALTLSGSNTYTGSTTITAGTLAIGGSGSLGTGGIYSAAIANNGTLLYGSSAVQTLSGVISGAGALTQSGKGTLMLTASNTYTGGTTISGGTLMIGSGGTAGAINSTSSLVDNGTLAFNHSDNIPFASAITGTGNVSQLGTGKLTLSTVEGYSGNTTISAGTLALTSAASISNSPQIYLAGGTTFDVTAKTTGGFVLSGTQTLTGNGSFAVAGTLSTTGAATIVPGGSLSVGTLTVGALTLNTGSVLKYDFGSGSNNNSLINVISSGGLNLAGATSLNIYQTDGSTPFSTLGTYDLFQYAGSLGGSAGNLSVADTSSAYTYTVGTTSGYVTLTIANGNPLDAWWLGSGSLAWSATGNWSSGVSGGSVSVLPGGGISAVHFGASAGTATVDSNFSVATLNFTAGSTGTTNSMLINSGGGTLTIGSGGVTDNGQAAQTVSAPLVLGAPQSWSVAGPQPLTVSSVISGTGSLTLASTSTGAVILSNNNVYSGGTTVSGGTLQLGDGSFNGSVPAAYVGNSGTLVFDSGTAQTYANSISGNGTLRVAGVAPLVLTVNEPFSGTTSINAGTLQLGNGSSNGSVAGNIADSASLVFDNGTAQSFSGTISGPGSLTMNGATTLTLSGANSYGGGTTINSGMLLMGSASALGTGNVTVAGGALNIGSVSPTLASGLTLASGTLTAGGGALTAAVTVNTAATVYIQGAGVLASGSSLTVSTGVLVLSGTESINSLTVSGGTLGGSALGVGAGGIAAQGGVVSVNLSGAGQLTASGNVLLNGDNSYSGGTSLGGGVLQLGSSAALPSTGSLTVNAGTLDLNGQNPTIGSLAGGASGTIVSSTGPGTLAVNTAATTAYNGLLADGGGQLGMVKQGAGSLTLGGVNTYSGGTTVNGGVLQLNNATALGSASGGLTVNAGTLDLNGQSPTVGALAGSGGTITSTNAPATLTAGSGNATSTFSSLIVDGNNTATVGLIKTGSGTLTLANSNNGYSGGTSITAGVLAINNGGNLGSGSLTLGAGTLQTSGSLTIDTALALSDPAAAIDVVDSGTTTTLAGLVSGSGALNMVGPGTLALANGGGNTYSGNTNVLSGTLLAEADNALSPNSTLMIGDGASVVLDFGGGVSDLDPHTVFATPSLAGPAFVAPGLSPAGISTVPEPGTLALLLAGTLAGLLVWRQRSR